MLAPQPWIINDEEAIPLLKYAWERGINTFDTANVYSNGESERIIGRFLTEYHIPREQILIFTKCFGLVVEHDISLQAWYNPQLLDEQRYVNQSGLSRTAIFHQVDKSLQRLQTSYIDLLQIHRFDPETPIEETMKALHDLVQSGKVRYLGASSMRAWQFAEMNHVAEKNGWTQFVSMQDEYSLLYREEVRTLCFWILSLLRTNLLNGKFPQEREMIPYCKAHGIGIIPWGPLAAGILARPFSAPSDDVSTSRPEPATARERFLSKTIFAPAYTLEDKTIIKRVEEIAHKKGWTMAQVALTWTMGNVTSPIVGISKV